MCLYRPTKLFEDKTWWNGPYRIDFKTDLFEIEDILLEEYFGIFNFPEYSLGYETLNKFKLKKNKYKKMLFMETQTFLIKDIIDLIFKYVS